MKINLRTEGFNLVQGTHKGVETKILEISDMFPTDTVYNVMIKRRDKGYKCEIRVQNGREFLRAEAKGDKIEFAVSNTVKVLKKRARKVNQMYIDKKRKTFISIEEQVSVLDSEVKKDWGIERIKELTLPFMTELEAIMELEVLDHDFFIFKNIEKEGKVCTLYRREEGYGLIITTN